MTRLELPIVAATLLEDRANVRRSATVQLEAGSHRFAVSAVSPIIADKSLQGKVSGAQGKVLDLQVTRRPRLSDDRPDPESQRLWQRVEDQREVVDALHRELLRLSATIAHYEALAVQWGQEMALDSSFAKADAERWKADWSALENRLSEVTGRHTEGKIRWQEQHDLLSDLTKQFHLLETPRGTIEATLELTVIMAESGQVELAVEYCVPNACWRPYHVAEWTHDGSLHFSSQACVWQNTGESWNDVSLSFSTERATLGTEPPELRGELLYLQPKQKKIVVTAREESVLHVEERVSGVPGIDAGGDTLRYTSPEVVTVPSDGRPHRVPLFAFEAPLREEKVLMSELSPEVFVRTKLENLAKGPILAGPVDLIKSCGLVGRGYLEFAAAGQTFSVGWGPHPELRCHRETQTSADEKSTLSGWRTKEHEVEVHLSNLGPHLQTVEVLERVPVSELKSVKVEHDLAKTTDKVSHDKDGFLRFPVELPPFGRKTITVAYLLSRKKDVEGL